MDAKRQQQLFERAPIPPCSDSGIVRLLYNHNPFYVISAGLVLFGIHVSFRDDAVLNDGWALFQILGAYTVLLVLSAILIVRIGAVWEDARTIIVLVLVLLVALSASFDRVCLDSVLAGRSIQFLGLVVAIVTIEALLRGVGARLAWRYKLPLYALFSLLFLYPVWLGHLSLTGQNNRMAWYVFLFPSLAGMVLLGLMPAARMAGSGEAPNGTPWTWPLYPWCGLGFIAVAFAVRSYGMSVSFALAGGLQSSFHAYFLIPFVLVVLALLVELAIATKQFALASTLSIAAVLAIPMALPGDLLSPVQLEFARTIAEQIGSPVQMTSMLLVVFFAWFATRRLKVAEVGLIVAAWMLISASRSSLGIESLRGPHWTIAATLAMAILLRSIQTGSTWRYFVAIAIGMPSVALRYNNLLEHPFLAFLAITLFAWLSAGLIFRDSFARMIRRYSQYVTIPSATLIAIGASRRALHGEPHGMAVVGLIVLLVSALAYWYAEPTVRRLLHACVVLLHCLFYGSLVIYTRLVEHSLNLKGKQWLTFGLISLLIGIAISLAKAGIARSLNAGVVGLNYHLSQWRRGSQTDA